MNKVRIISFCLTAVFLGGCMSLNTTVPVTIPEIPEIKGPYYQPENSGAGFRLATTPPQGSGIEEHDEYLLDMIQGLISANFSKYSRFTLIKLKDNDFDEAISEEASASEETTVSEDAPVSGEDSESAASNDDSASTVKFINYDYLLGGKLTALPERKFNLSLTITDSVSGAVVAAYTENNFTIQDIMDGVIGNASRQLLEEMGVALLDAGKEAITAEAQFNALVQAKLARSRSALKNEKNIAALVNAYGAAEYAPSFPEAVDQLRTASNALSTGNVGTREVILSDYQQQQRWLEQLIEFETYYRDHHPFDIYYSVPEKKGETNYSTGTVDLEFLIGIQPSVSFNIMQNVIKDISGELNKTKNRKRWGFEEWPVKFREFDLYTQRKFTVIAGLYNGDDIEIKRVSVDLQTQLMSKNEAVYFDATQKIPAVFKDVIVGDLVGDLKIRLLSIDNVITTEDGIWLTHLVPIGEFPAEKRATIPQKQRTISRQPAAVAPIKQAPKPKPTSFEEPPLKEKRIGASASALLNPVDTKNTAMSVTLDGGLGALTAEFISHFPFDKDLYNFAIGGGLGFSVVFDYVLTSLTFGVTYIGLPENEKVTPMYLLLKADVTPFKKWAGVRLGFLMEMGSSKWGSAYDSYFKYAMNPDKDFRLNGKFMTGLVFWL